MKKQLEIESLKRGKIRLRFQALEFNYQTLLKLNPHFETAKIQMSPLHARHS